MSIVLSWTKKDSDDVLQGYEIYRSTVKATVFDAANKLASSTDKSLVTYTDVTAASDVPYYYGVRSLTIFGNVDSTPVLLVDPSIVGSGSALPTIGDFDDGFIEMYVNEQSFSAAALKILTDQIAKAYPASVFDLTVGPITAGGITSYTVNKFWKNGKVIFAPNHPQGGINGGGITFGDVQTKVIAPLVAAKPRVEIDGIMYDFNFMTVDEAQKYLGCGALSPQSATVTHYTDRVVPKTFNTVNPNGTAFRAFVRNTGDTTYAAQADGAGVLQLFNSTTAVGTWLTPFAWYFTPVLA